MDRRQFLKNALSGVFTISAASVLSPVDALAKTAKKKKGKDYNVVILGDTHFDTLPDSVYHSGYDEEDKARVERHRKEFKRNGEMWRDRCPRLVKRAACLEDEKTKMVFQVGDLIQGDTCGKENHIRMLDDTFRYFKEQMGPLPFITVAGNHDLRAAKNEVAREAYGEYMPARMSEELGQKVEGTTFAFRIEQDAYIVIDFTYPDDEEVVRLLEQTRDARYTFIIIHSPVFPMDHVKFHKWYYHGKDKTMEARDRMRRLLAEREAIVLCGHSHTTELYDWYGDGGRITQMVMNSVWAKEALGSYVVLVDTPQGYGSLREAKLQESGKPVKPSDKKLFDDIRPGLKRYSHSFCAGSYKLCVSDKGVYVDFYAGDSTRATHRFQLR